MKSFDDMSRKEHQLIALIIVFLFVLLSSASLPIRLAQNVAADPIPMTVTLSPLADCGVNQDQPTTNYGNAENWEVNTKWPNDNKRVYLKFDMSSLSPTISVQLATLRIYCFYGYWLSPPDTNVEARRVSDDTWTQSGLTWNNQPGGGAIEASLAPAVGQWNEWNVTSYVQDELPSDSILGLVLKSQTEDLDEYYHYSRYYSQREVGYPAWRPQLYIEYTIPAPIITSTAPTGAWEDHAYSYSPTCDQTITTWGLTTNASWLSQNGATGEVSGTPDNTNSTKSYSVSISATNANGTGYENYTVTVANNIPVITTTPGSSVWATKTFYYNASADDGGSYGGTFGAITTNWTGAYSWTASTGKLYFTPNVKGSFWFNITFNDNSGAGNATISQNFTVTVGKPYYTSVGLTSAWEDHAYSYTPTVNTTVASWGYTSNGSWINQNSGTGEVYGTPDNSYSEQSYWVNISASTQLDGTVYQNYSVLVHNYAPQFTSTPPTTGVQYISYNANTDDEGVGVPGGNYSSISTNFTDPYTFGLTTGVLDLTVLHSGTFWFNITADDQTGASNATAWQNFTVSIVNQAPFFLTTPLTTIQLGGVYSYDPTTDEEGLGGDYALIYDSRLALSFNPITGIITFNAQIVGVFLFNLTFDDGSGALNATVSQAWSVTVHLPSEPSMSVRFTFNVRGSTINFTDISQGTGIITWHWDFGDGHESSTQDPTHTYDEIGNYTVVLTVTDAAGHTGSARKTIVVSSVSSQPMIPGAWAWIIPLSLLGLGIAGIARSRNPFIQSVCAILVAIAFVALIIW